MKPSREAQHKRPEEVVEEAHDLPRGGPATESADEQQKLLYTFEQELSSSSDYQAALEDAAREAEYSNNATEGKIDDEATIAARPKAVPRRRRGMAEGTSRAPEAGSSMASADLVKAFTVKAASEGDVQDSGIASLQSP